VISNSSRGGAPGIAGFVGAAAVVTGLLAVWLWAEILMGPVRLATGLLDARDHLNAAQRKLSPGRIDPARYDIFAGAAAARTARAGHDSEPFMALAKVLPGIGGIVDQSDHLVAAAEYSAEAAGGTIELFDSALSGPDGIIAEDSGPSGGQIRLHRVEEMTTTVEGVYGALQHAKNELESIDLAELPRRIRNPVVSGIKDADETQSVLDDAQRGLALLPAILGADGPRTYIVGMLNNAELRGSGGSLLQYALLEIDQGEMRLDGPQTVYEIDRGRMQLDIPLPEDAWYVRGIPDARRFGNANWSPDWPLSAQLTIDYAREREPDLEVDGFIAMTPSVLQNLVQSTGPFRTKWDIRITRDNAVSFLLHDAYGQFPKPSVRRTALKQVVKGFFDRLLRPKNPVRLVQGLSRGLADKDVQIWMAAEEEQRFIKHMNWDGAIKKATNKDYLNVVQQNVGGNKLDYFAEQKTGMDVAFDGADAIASTTVEILNGVVPPQATWAMGNSGPLHRPMINVYAPGDAVLESASVSPETCPECAGFPVGNKKTGKLPSPGLRRLDSPEPARWIGGLPAEHIELGKKVWSATLQIPPLQSAGFELRYRNPNVVRTKDGRSVYRLVLQHQPKVRPDEVRLQITLPDGATDIRANAFKREGNVLVWERRLNRDIELEVSWREQL
jgi:hypothetical protein